MPWKTEQDYDFITVTNANGEETRYSGFFNKKFQVQGNTISIKFTSDDCIVEKGVKITIKKLDKLTDEEMFKEIFSVLLSCLINI